MTEPKYSSRSATIPVRDPSLPLSSNKHLLRWIQKMFILTQPDAIHWVDGSEEENDALCQQMVEGGTFIKLERGTLAGVLLCQIRSGRRGPRGRPHVHLLPFQGRCRPDKQLGKPIRNAPEAERAFQRVHARTHHVCAAVQHGSYWLADVANRRSVDRFTLCRR